MSKYVGSRKYAVPGRSVLSSKFARVIVNPAAGAGKTGRDWPQMGEFFKRRGLRFEHDITEAPGHATELARSAVAKGYELIVSVGGDGTIHEIVNGMYQDGGNKDVLLGIVSTGTGSDYIRTVGLPRRYEEACERFLKPIKITVDLGVVEYQNNGTRQKRLFVNFAGMGFDAEIVRRTTQHYKAMGSLLSYLMGTLATVVSYRNREISLRVDGIEVTRKVCTVIMNNGKYGGGGMLTAPGADLSDGLLDVITVGDISRPDLLYSLPRIYKGTHVTHPKVSMAQAREIEIGSLDGIMHLQADGELLGELPARFSVLPLALNIAV
jgi:diacylglycerol kinase (ATP)